jgi:hypothetical protein
MSSRLRPKSSCRPAKISVTQEHSPNPEEQHKVISFHEGIREDSDSVGIGRVARRSYSPWCGGQARSLDDRIRESISYYRSPSIPTRNQNSKSDHGNRDHTDRAAQKPVEMEAVLELETSRLSSPSACSRSVTP